MVIVFTLILFVLIFLATNVLRISAHIQYLNPTYRDALRLEKIAKKNGNFLPLRYRYDEWAEMRSK